MARYNCKFCGAPSLNETCWRHTPKAGPVRNSPIKRKSPTKEELEENTEESAKMWDFFMTIWDSRPHICEETGKYLGMEPKWTYFHHLLYKQTYPQFQYEDWNIILLHPDVHTLYHQDIDKFPNIKDRADDLWLDYVLMHKPPKTKTL